jgi:hypothetical protein
MVNNFCSPPEAERRRQAEELSASIAADRFDENLLREYSASVEKLAPLLERIGEVDRLIDAIVYRLYGLTAEEVAIVEESLS